MPPSKRCTMVFKAYSVSKELRNKAVAYSAISDVTKKKFKNIVPTPSRTG